MKILVINCGSSSVKYQLLDMNDESVIAKGNYERIGMEGSFLTHKVGDDKYTFEEQAEDHDAAISLILKQLTDEEHGVIKSLDEIGAVGHRVLHGAEDFTESVIVTDEVLKICDKNTEFGPLHMPAKTICNACEWFSKSFCTS